MSVRKVRLEVRGPDRTLAEEPAALIAHGGVCEGCALKRNRFSGLRWPPWQSLASGHVSSLAWAGGNTHCEA